MKARVIVTLKAGVLDPQGKAIEGALKSLAVDGLTSVRQGKVFDIEIDSDDHAGSARDARRGLRAACSPTPSSRITRSRSANAMRAAVILFPGSIAKATSPARSGRRRAPSRSIVWHDETGPAAAASISSSCPADFSYGDYLRCGAIAARAPIMRAVGAHAARGGLVLGICNGFQILCEAGLLPGVLMRNADLRFICKMQHLRVENAQTPFTRRYAPGQVVKFAIAHGEGNYVADKETIRGIEAEGRVAFRYCDAEGTVGDAQIPTARSTTSPASSTTRFNVLGLMPHPENLIDPLVGASTGADFRVACRVTAAWRRPERRYGRSQLKKPSVYGVLSQCVNLVRHYRVRIGIIQTHD